MATHRHRCGGTTERSCGAPRQAGRYRCLRAAADRRGRWCRGVGTPAPGQCRAEGEDAGVAESELSRQAGSDSRGGRRLRTVTIRRDGTDRETDTWTTGQPAARPPDNRTANRTEDHRPRQDFVLRRQSTRDRQAAQRRPPVQTSNNFGVVAQ